MKFPDNPRTAEIEFFSFEFERPYLGREGPNFTELEGEPSAGAQYLATAELFREDAVSTAKFELVDEDGRVIDGRRGWPSARSEKTFEHAPVLLAIDSDSTNCNTKWSFWDFRRPEEASVLQRVVVLVKVKGLAVLHI